MDNIYINKIKSWVSVLFECIIIIMAILAFLEIGSRLVHQGSHPAIPYSRGINGGPRLPQNLDISVKFSGMDDNRLCTDKMGLRQQLCEKINQDGDYDLLVIGDSQAVGWGFEASKSLAGYLSGNFGFEPTKTGILASAGTDVELLNFWVGDVAKAIDRKELKQVVVMLNLGNDLDEMVYGRANVSYPKYPSLSLWLAKNSFLFQDYVILSQSLKGGGFMPPGANPITVSLSESELHVLADATVNAVLRILSQFPEHTEKHVVIVAADYQVFPSEFDKYRSFYDDESKFEYWKKAIPHSVNALNIVEERVSERLNEAGISNFSTSDILSDLAPEVAFDRFSHHLTPAANKKLANVISKYQG